MKFKSLFIGIMLLGLMTGCAPVAFLTGYYNNHQAVQYYKQGHFKQALSFAEKAYRASQDGLGERHPNTLRTINSLAKIYKALGRFSDALPLYEKGYRLRKEVLGERHRDTLISLGNLALIYKDLGRLSDALPLSEKAYRLRKEVLGERHPNTLTSLGNLAEIYRAIGHLSDAFQLSEKAYRLIKEVLGEKHPNTLTSLNNLAGIYKDLGRFSEALPLREKNYNLTKEVLGEKHPSTLKRLHNLAVIYADNGRFSEALPLFEKCYRLKKEVLGEKHPSTINSRTQLALAMRQEDQISFSEVLSVFEKTYRFLKETLGEKHPETITSLIAWALRIDSSSEALPLLEKAYRLSKEVLGEKHYITLASMSNLAYKYISVGNINQGIKHLETLVAGVESLRSGDLSAENRQSLFKRYLHHYFVLSYRYAKHTSLQDAFRIAEMSKARTLLESLTAKRAAQESGLTKAEQQKLQDYEARLAFFNDRIGKALKANRIDDRVRLETDKNQLIAELAQFERQLRAKYSKYDQLSQVQILSAKKGAKYLPNNAVLISYLVSGNQVLAFTLENNGKLTAHKGKIHNIEKDLEAYRLGLAPQTDSSMDQNQAYRPFSSKRSRETQALGKRLGKFLLEPLKDIIKDKSHWIISPSGPLALIPFETLRFEGEKQPVIAQHQISYVQSLSILAMLQKRDKAYKRIKNRDSLFAMGAPIYQQSGKASKIGKQPSKADFKIARGLVQNSQDYTRALRQLDLNWRDLPGTLDELLALKQIFRGAPIYKQEEATEAKLQSLNQQGILEKYRYLVFSAHGYLSPDVPALSSLVLGQVNNPKGTDGYVTAGEWPGYDLKSDLIVLSACETGLGEVVGGEGVMGLPYALFVAGNKNTLLTLWSISDEVTVEFMTSFFRKLKAGKGQIEALTATKREFLNKGEPYNNPKYWAAFVLYGV